MTPFLPFAILSASLTNVPISADELQSPEFFLAPTPHFNERPLDAVVDTIVLHHTAGDNLEGVVKWFQNPDSKVSAHFTVGKDARIAMHVNTFYRAWHAGVSKDKFGRGNVNDFSVGIEIVNVGDGKHPYPPAQVEAVRLLVSSLCHYRYKGQIRQITSHEHIAEPQGRKNDPINYPWESLEPLSKELGIPLVYGRK